MKTQKFTKLVAIFSLLVSGIFLFAATPVFAEETTTNYCNTHPDSETCILNKAVLENIYQCYKNGGVNNNIANFDNYTSVFNNSKSYGLPAKYTTTGYLWNKSDSGTPINCITMADGSRDYSGIRKADFTYNGEKIDINTNDTSNETVKKKFLAGFGYEAENTTLSENCFYIYYYRYWTDWGGTELTGSHAADFTYCPTLASDGQTISKFTKEENSTVDGGGWECQKIWGSHCYVYIEEVNNEDGYVNVQRGYASPIFGCWWDCDAKKVYFKGVTWNSFIQNLNATLDELVPGRSGTVSDSNMGYLFKNLSVHIESHSSVITSYKLVDQSKERGIYSLSAESLHYSDLKFSEKQAIVLYESYIKNVYASDKHISYPETESAFVVLNDDPKYKPTAWVDTEGKHTCAYVLINDDTANDKVYGLDGSMHFNGTNSGLIGRDQTFAKLEQLLGPNTCSEKKDNIDPDYTVEIDPGEAAEGQVDIGTEEPHGSDFLDACNQKLSLGWLFCPILDALAQGLDALEKGLDELF
ncbi:hypothetical protein IJF86_00575 [Candidatus Saccharibacteria bacterium]|nr:hypothetical protein [Candidatus Saccharibacteria bacterium]